MSLKETRIEVRDRIIRYLKMFLKDPEINEWEKAYYKDTIELITSYQERDKENG